MKFELDISTVGIDPGLSGAMALLSNGRYVTEIYDWTDGPSTAAALITWITLYDVKMTILERVSTRPGQGVASQGKFLRNAGWWAGALDTLSTPWLEVSPQTWQRGLIPKKSSELDKPSLTVARRQFPDASLHLKKHHNRADAIMMAVYAYNRVMGQLAAG